MPAGGRCGDGSRVGPDLEHVPHRPRSRRAGDGRRAAHALRRRRRGRHSLPADRDATRRCSPGAGKALLTRALPGILPPLSAEESLEVSKIYSIAGLLPRDRPLVVTRPFRAPHHTASHAGRVGGGRTLRAGGVFPG